MILVVAAMQEEVKELINFSDDTVKVILTGVGKVNAARALTEAILQTDVQMIYNLGFAGATKPFEVGDIVLIEDAAYHDFDLSLFGYEKGQVPQYPSKFKSDLNQINRLENKFKDMKKGHLLTGDYFTTQEYEFPVIVDMEGAALFQVAHYYKIPILSIKVVSDIIGMKDHINHYKKFEQDQGALALKLVYQKLFEGK